MIFLPIGQVDTLSLLRLFRHNRKINETCLHSIAYIQVHRHAGYLPNRYLIALHLLSELRTKKDNIMYGLIGKIIAKDGHRDELIQILLDGTSDMPGCLSYIISKDINDEHTIWITEVWDRKESHPIFSIAPIGSASHRPGPSFDTRICRTDKNSSCRWSRTHALKLCILLDIFRHGSECGLRIYPITAGSEEQRM